MGIVSFSFEDRRQGWKLEKVEFDDVTLLVGASGVGKSRILSSLLRVRDIALSRSKDGSDCSWELELDAEGRRFRWLGTTKPSWELAIAEEQVFENDRLIHDRSSTAEMADGAPSLVTMWGSGRLAHLHRALCHVRSSRAAGVPVSDEDMHDLPLDVDEFELPDNGSAVDTRVLTAGYLLQERRPERFAELVLQLRDVFPTVAEVRFREAALPYSASSRVWFEVTEDGVREPVPADSLSVGMLRTWMHILELAVLPSGSVCLVDEFENSLGINCLGPVTDLMMDRSDEVQFILTSHHPYIIHNIPKENWRLVTRHGSTVRALRPDVVPALRGESRLDDFFRLINASEYRDGIS